IVSHIIFLALSCTLFCPVSHSIGPIDGLGAVVTINEVAGFTDQRVCVQYCLWNPGGDDVRAHMGCPAPNGWGRNVCFCRNDLATYAHSWITDCVNYRCQSNTAEIQIAVSMFDNYCAPGRTNAPQTNIVITTQADSKGSSNIDSAGTATVVSTVPISTLAAPSLLPTPGYSGPSSPTSLVTSPPPAGSSPGGPLSPATGDPSNNSNGTRVQTVAIVIPIIAVLVAAVAVAYFYFRWKKARLAMVLEVRGEVLPPSYKK
ncbi:hypothetical protein B0O99DRAFT_701854, partial [Bisporella sp. PMI_857]